MNELVSSTHKVTSSGRRSRRFGPAFVLIATIATLFAVSCSRHDAEAKPPEVDYYTCTMHPSVKSHKPKDKCPICSMELVPVKKKQNQFGQPGAGEKAHNHAKMLAEQAPAKLQAKAEEGSSEFTVPVSRQQQFGVTYATAERRPLRHTIRTVGMATYDKQRHWDYVARIDGYVQKLFVSSRGEWVEKEQPLLTIYSPELLTTQREFVDVLRMRDEARKSGSQAALETADRLIASGKVRLRLWNITDRQITELEETRAAKETLTLYSPFRGVVQDLPVDQGRRVMAGDHLVDIADLSVVWVWAEFYQDELPFLKTGLSVAITTSSYPGETFAGKIALVDPFISQAKRTGRIRLDIDNSGLKLRPDMYVDVELEVDLGEGLTIPVTAVMPTGKRNVVFVDKGEGRMEPRFVELARKVGSNYLVTAGVTNGERVVNSANFLIDAEAQVQGALKNWSDGAKE